MVVRTTFWGKWTKGCGNPYSSARIISGGPVSVIWRTESRMVIRDDKDEGLGWGTWDLFCQRKLVRFEEGCCLKGDVYGTDLWKIVWLNPVGLPNSPFVLFYKPFRTSGPVIEFTVCVRIRLMVSEFCVIILWGAMKQTRTIKTKESL